MVNRKRKVIRKNKKEVDINAVPNGYEWIKTSTRLKEITSWNIPREIIPFNLRVEGCKRFNDSGIEKIRTIIESLTPLTQISQKSNFVSIGLFHPFGLTQLLMKKGVVFRSYFADIRFPDDVAINLDIDNKMPGYLWFGGCPTIEVDQFDGFKEAITTSLEQFSKSFPTKFEDMHFVFKAEYDSLRRELLVKPEIVKNGVMQFSSALISIEAAKLLHTLTFLLRKKKIKWETKELVFMVRGASDEYRDEWIARRASTAMTLTHLEENAMRWTDKYVDDLTMELKPRVQRKTYDLVEVDSEEEKKKKDAEVVLGPSGRPLRYVSKEVKSSRMERLKKIVKKEEEKEYREPNRSFFKYLPSKSHVVQSREDDSSSDSEVDVVTVMPVDVDVEDTEMRPATGSRSRREKPSSHMPSSSTRYEKDLEVERVMMLATGRKQLALESQPETSLKITDFDIKGIQERLHNMGFRDPEKRRKRRRNIRTNKNDNKLKKLMKIPCKPWVTPAYYKHLGTRKDSVGNLAFYHARRKRTLAKGRVRDPELPDYDLIDADQEYEDTDRYHEYLRGKANVCTDDCSQHCDMTEGCKPDSCSCMRKSVMNEDGLIGQSRNPNRMVYECCERCPCALRKDTCPSIVQFRRKIIQSPYLSTMGYTFRAMENIQRGEAIISFTGERQLFVSEEDEVWSCTLVNTKERGWKKFTGLKDSDIEIILNPRKKGNGGRFVCHSYFANCDFMFIYRGGMNSTQPEICIYAIEPIEAGSFLYINYGADFGITKDMCKCTQPFCHDKKINVLVKKLSYDEGFELFLRREKLMRARMILLEIQAVRNWFQHRRELHEYKKKRAGIKYIETQLKNLTRRKVIGFPSRKRRDLSPVVEFSIDDPFTIGTLTRSLSCSDLPSA